MLEHMMSMIDGGYSFIGPSIVHLIQAMNIKGCPVKKEGKHSSMFRISPGSLNIIHA